MTKRKWHSGPPPHVGWWNASNTESSWAWRWWDGQFWSVLAEDIVGKDKAAWYASNRDMVQATIEWTDYYPANARVPRVKS